MNGFFLKGRRRACAGHQLRGCPFLHFRFLSPHALPLTALCVASVRAILQDAILLPSPLTGKPSYPPPLTKNVLEESPERLTPLKWGTLLPSPYGGKCEEAGRLSCGTCGVGKAELVEAGEALRTVQQENANLAQAAEELEELRVEVLQKDMELTRLQRDFDKLVCDLESADGKVRSFCPSLASSVEGSPESR